MSTDVWAIIGVGVAILCFGGIAYRSFVAISVDFGTTCPICAND